jgi:hypothetical protein
VALSRVKSNAASSFVASAAASFKTRRRAWLAGLVVLLLLVGGWIYSRRVARVEMAAYVPESALGYVEVNDLPRLADRLTSTDAWETLAPAYGLPASVRYAGWLGSAARWTGVGPREAVLLARAQFAVAVTGIEVRGEEVKPRLAFLVESHGDAQALSAVIAERLPQLAARAYGEPRQEATEYSGVPVTVYKSADGERRILSAQIGSLWILANHPDPLRACIDTRQGRTPSMANNFYLKQSRPTVEQGGAGDLFAFVSGSGVSRLMQFGAHLVAGRALSSTPFSGLVEGLLADISGRALDGVAYGAAFENGGVVDRYAVLFKPEVADSLRAAVQVPKEAGEGRVLKVVPAAAREVTVISVTDLDLALAGLQNAVSSQIGAGQSFLLQRFVNSAREAFFGLKPGERASPAIGGEVAGFSFAGAESPGRDGEQDSDRVWLIAVRDRQLLSALAERYLSQRGAGLRRESYGGTEFMISGDARRGAAAFVDDYLALGGRHSLMRLIDARRQGSSLGETAQFAAAGRPAVADESALRSFSHVGREAGRMMAALARNFGADKGSAGQSGAGQGAPSAERKPLLDQLPLAASAAALTERGVYVESHSPLGNFPLFVSLFDGQGGQGDERAQR